MKKLTKEKTNGIGSTASWAIEMVQKQPIALGLLSEFGNETSKLDFMSQEMWEKMNA